MQVCLSYLLKCVLFAYTIGAEVGQALLQKYEAYVRRHEVCRAYLRGCLTDYFLQAELRGSDTQVDSPVDHIGSRVTELQKENMILQKVSLSDSNPR